MIWFLCAGLALFAALLILSARAREGAHPDPVNYYKDQLRDLEDEVTRGLIDAEAARAARLEIERRILKAAHTDHEAITETNSRPWTAVAAALVVAGAFGFYILTGRPDLPASPAAILDARERPIEEGGPSYAEAIDSIQQHLAANPDDARGWEVLAKSARAAAEHTLAAKAFARLAELQPDEPRWRIHEFESYLALAGGQITPAARLVLSDVLKVAPEHPAARYYLGLAHLQAGDNDQARAVWTALADSSPGDAPWMPMLRAQLADLGVKPPQLSQDQVAAVEAMDAKDRAAFIQSMLARLKARLEAEPDDADGWLMLARSHLAMGDKAAAYAALEQGIAVVSPDKRAQLQAFLDNLQSGANP